MTRRYQPTPFGRFLTPREDRVLPHRVDCYEREDHREDAGSRSPKDVFRDCTPVLRNVPCWVQSPTPEERVEFDRQQLVITQTVTFYQDPMVNHGDYLVFQGTRLFRIEGVNDASGVGLVFVATCREVT